MFIGSNDYNLDSKGRLTLPVEFREELGQTVYVTRGFEGCLSVYSESEFMIILNRLKGLKESNKEAREYIRMLSSNTKKIDIDKMGRINLSEKLIKLGHLKKECTVLGQLNRVEIWDKEEFDRYYEEHEDHYEESAELAFKEDN